MSRITVRTAVMLFILTPAGDNGPFGETVADGRIDASLFRTGQPSIFLTLSSHKVMPAQSHTHTKEYTPK